MQMMKVAELVPHPRNDEFFDDMSGEKWNEFLESVKTSGVIEPIVITQDKVIVSGHQRVRACKELGIDTIMAETRHYANDDAVLKDLIETNVRQRGSIGGSDIKLGNRIRALERIYGISHGGDRSKSNNVGVGKVTQEDLLAQLGLNKETYRQAKILSTLPPEVQDLVEQGNISPSTASRLIAKLTPEEQEKLISTLPVSEHFTQKQVQSYVDQIRMKDNQIAGYELKAEQDKQEKERLRTELEEARNVEPETVVKEVVPDDYEELKSDKERLASENKLLKSERDTLKKDYQARCKEVNEMRDTMSAIREDSAREDIMDELEQDCIFFCARCDSFLKAVGGYAYLADRLDLLLEEQRKSYVNSVKAIMAWAQNIIYAMEENK